MKNEQFLEEARRVLAGAKERRGSKAIIVNLQRFIEAGDVFNVAAMINSYRDWLDENEIAYPANVAEFCDGVKRGWHENGQMRYESLPNGTRRRWHTNGQMSYERLPDGTDHGWYENGQMSYESLPDGTDRRWHESGQMFYEYLPNGTVRRWDIEGNEL